MKLKKANELMQKCKTNAMRKLDTRCCGCRIHQNYRYNDPSIGIPVSCSIFEPNSSQTRWQENCDQKIYGMRPPPITWGILTRPRYFTKEDISPTPDEENKLRSKSENENISEKHKYSKILQITNPMAAIKEEIEDDDSSSISEDVYECNEQDKQEDDEENSGDTGIIQLEENKKEDEKEDKEGDKKEDDSTTISK
ncbi:hypothetical protein Trydic_g18700, partial [Trypoxylus dichotomus]